MKVTKKELQKAVLALSDVDMDSTDIHIGVEAKGKMVVVYCTQGVSRDFAQSFSMSVLELAEDHGETYTPYIMRKPWFERYVAHNGFVEVEEEKFPIYLSFGDCVGIYARGDWSTTVSYEALEVFLRDALDGIERRRNDSS